MDTPTNDQAVVNEKIWLAWVQENKLSEEATARKLKLLAGIVLVLLVLGSAFYFLAVGSALPAGMTGLQFEKLGPSHRETL